MTIKKYSRRLAARRMLRVTTLTLLVIATMPWARPLAQQLPPPAQYGAVGLQPDRGYFAQVPFEHIDMVNGNLILTFTDFVLPGNAGMDLRFVRTYNHQALGHKWSFGFAGVPIRIVQPEPPAEGAWEPAALTADGSSHALLTDPGADPDILITKQFWRYRRSTRTLELHNGWVATYETGVNPSGGIMLVEVHDVFGNSITPDWIGGAPEDVRPLRLEAVTQVVGDATLPTRSRVLTFSYSPNYYSPVPTTMTYEGRTWTYTHDYVVPNTAARLLTHVQPPIGPGWGFAYVMTELNGTVTVTTPSGGTVSYGMEGRALPEYETVQRSVVASATLGGRDVPSSTWTFAYQQTDGYPKGTASGPGARAVVFNHRGSVFSGSYAPGWVLTAKTLFEGETQVARLSRSYENVPLTSTVPSEEIDVESWEQDGRTFTTTYDYRAESWGDYHRPWRITETGEVTRVTTRTFDYDVDIHILPVASETVTIGTESFTTSYAHENATGFLESQTIYGVTSTFGRDAFGNRASVTDAQARTTTFTYRSGALQNTSTPRYTIYRSINADGTIAEETRRGGPWNASEGAYTSMTTKYFYINGRLDRVEPSLGDITYHLYDDVGGQWTKVTRGPSETTTWIDGLGRPRVTRNPAGVYTETSYTVDGLTQYQSRPYVAPADNVGDDFSYDALGRVKKVIHADDSEINYSYSGATVTITDEENHATVQTWAAFGSPNDARLASVRDAATNTWSYTYNALGNLRTVTQPGGLVREWSYDAQNRLEWERHPESAQTSYAYYPTGALQFKNDALGQIFTYSYDTNDRLTAIDAPGSTVHDVEVLDYDEFDNRRRVRNGFADTVLRYDTGNRLIQREDTVNGHTGYVTYGYDNRDNLTAIGYPTGRTITYDISAGNQITAVREGATVWASNFTYHPSGGLAGYTARNGQTTSIGYTDPHERYWPSSVQSGPLSLSYTYDKVGNVATISDSRPSYNQTFGYDAIDRLTAVSGYGAGSFQYDARGNRTHKDDVLHTYHPTTDRLESDGVTSFTYDAVGNTRTAGGSTYTYTPFQMLETATLNGGTTTYRYDADNRRVMRITSSGTDYFVAGPNLVPLAEYREGTGGFAWVRDYLYAGSHLIAAVNAAGLAAPSASFAEALIARETTMKVSHITELRAAIDQARGTWGLAAYGWLAAPTPQVTIITPAAVVELRAALAAVYTQAGITPPAITDPDLTAGTLIKRAHIQELRDAVSTFPAPTELYYHADALGSVRAVTTSNGAVLRRHDYRPFGDEPTPVLAADARRFTGKERDHETGLQYFGARYAANGIGRFSSVDPLMGTEVALTDPQRWNRYSYVGNRPTRVVDPDGAGWLSALAKLAIKGGDIGSTAHGVVQDVSTIFSQDSRVGTGERLVATASLVSEFLPISGRDISTLSSFAMKFGDEATGSFSRVVGFTERSLQKGFTKHGADFGLSGNWNPKRAAEFSRAVHLHINNLGTRIITGTYRGQKVTHYLDPNTGLNVIVDEFGNYVSGFELGASQLDSVLSTGRLF